MNTVLKNLMPTGPRPRRFDHSCLNGPAGDRAPRERSDIFNLQVNGSGGECRIKLSCQAKDGLWELNFDYDPATYCEADIHRLSRQFLRLLVGAVERPSAKIGELNFLTADESIRFMNSTTLTQSPQTASACTSASRRCARRTLRA